MFELLPQVLVSGVSLGMIYGLVAFGYQLTYVTSKTVNFGQAEALAVGALVGLSLQPILGYWMAIPVVMMFGALYGAAVERIAVRPALRAGTEGWILSTIALGIIMKNVAENIWGKEDLPFPSPLPPVPLSIASAYVMPMEILIVAGALVLMLAIEALNRLTLIGKAFVATADDRDAASLMGISTRAVIAGSFAVSCSSAAYAGILIAPVTLTGASMGLVLVLKGFAAAILGGLTSGVGALVGGLVIGVAEAVTAFYVSTGYKEIPGLVILLIALAFRPEGLFGKPLSKKV
ncbi:branched-chain amino acid ABC transporter permease [Ensifer sp.]|uniref:branched-chain amino acid ABC transporter permease n=1 Tax=Ensifer sp. TaxID=1872086 RepID=UPI002E0D1724|nr:branched-chain amino acid ABC transporter permease [Ensifer sp.]